MSTSVRKRRRILLWTRSFQLGLQIHAPGGPDGGQILDVIPGHRRNEPGWRRGCSWWPWTSGSGRRYFAGCNPAGEGPKEPIELLAENGDYFRTYKIGLSRGREIPASGIDFGEDGCVDGNCEDEGRAGGGACEIIFKGIQIDGKPARIGAHDRPLEFDGFDGQFDCGRKYFQTAGGFGSESGRLESVELRGGGLGILVIAGCIAEVSSRYEETGGLYLYARDALGRFAGLLVAWMTWLTRIAAPAAAANLVWRYSAKFLRDWKAGRANF